MSLRTLFRDMEAEAFRRSEYRRIRFELAHLSLRDQLDTGIRPDDADRIAHQMVYG